MEPTPSRRRNVVTSWCTSKAKKAKLDPSPVHPIPGARTEVWASQDEEGEAKAKKGKPHSTAFKLRLVRSVHLHIDPDT